MPVSSKTCTECGAELPREDQTCAKCGTAFSYEPAEAAVGCAVCEAVIDAYVETCPACGETGYPALRPRRGKRWLGAPDDG